MQTPNQGEDAGAYDFYRGGDGYYYPLLTNLATGTPLYPPPVALGVAGHNSFSGVATEPAAIDPMEQDIDGTAGTHDWHQSSRVSAQTGQSVEGYPQLAPDIRSGDPNDPLQGPINVVPAERPFIRLVTASNRSYDTSSVYIGGVLPAYVPTGRAPAASSSPITPSTSIPGSAGVEEGDDSDQEYADEALPLIKLGFGAWKCGVCGKQLRRKHRAVVHFLNKHGDVRLKCQGRCGVESW
ncbi:hypothetical protein M408DRAFT_330377 [Serendipita vermifera MAFF 305830]|uniref:C2H2-type domain-containing protein n=1 Tax=Serendipita vermifera MAFF 305830 TaxID=933852 RepID=A0A0C2XC88_SERVB|nr:hypothetical protein M408DRAFT_330377 [Serendipita vermifera MAFF 305830]